MSQFGQVKVQSTSISSKESDSCDASEPFAWFAHRCKQSYTLSYSAVTQWRREKEQVTKVVARLRAYYRNQELYYCKALMSAQEEKTDHQFGWPSVDDDDAGRRANQMSEFKTEF